MVKVIRGAYRENNVTVIRTEDTLLAASNNAYFLALVIDTPYLKTASDGRGEVVYVSDKNKQINRWGRKEAAKQIFSSSKTLSCYLWGLPLHFSCLCGPLDVTSVRFLKLHIRQPVGPHRVNDTSQHQTEPRRTDTPHNSSQHRSFFLEQILRTNLSMPRLINRSHLHRISLTLWTCATIQFGDLFWFLAQQLRASTVEWENVDKNESLLDGRRHSATHRLSITPVLHNLHRTYGSSWTSTTTT